MAEGIRVQLWGGHEDGRVLELPPGPPPMSLNTQGPTSVEYDPTQITAVFASTLPTEVYDRVPLSLAAVLLGRRAHVMVYVHRPLVDRWTARGHV